MKIFIDDERFPPDDGCTWKICRTLEEFQALIESGAKPIHISFDHDLGDNIPTGMDIAKWLIEFDLDNDILTPDFTWYAHSQNPNGRDNINGILKSYSVHSGKNFTSE